MTIDMHSHLFVKEFLNDSYIAPFWDEGEHLARSYEEALSEAKRRSILRPLRYDPDGTEHINRMDLAGIEKAVILHLDYGLLFGEAELSIEQQNKHVSDIVKRHPDRFAWFCGIDPRRKEAAELFDKCVHEWGAKGLKLYPTTGFLPADKEVYPLYESAVAWNIPVYFHMGPENPPYKNEGNAHPSTLLRILVDFPDLKVIVAHLAFEFWRDLIALGKTCDNVWSDFCAWQPIATQNFGQFCYILRKFIDEFGLERIMFGTDAPLIEDVLDSKAFVTMIKELPEKAPENHSFAEEEISALLELNARNLLDSIG